MINRNYLLFLTLFIFGCSRIVFSPSEIRHWAPQLESEEPYSTPYLSFFSSYGKTLIYLAADHDNRIDGPTFKTINKVIKEENPDIIVLEAFPNKDGISPTWTKRRVKKCIKSNFKKCGEPFYAIKIALELGIDFVGGELTDREIYDELLKEKYRPIDILGFYLVRHIPALIRRGRFQESNFSKQAVKLMSSYASDMAINNVPSFSEFDKWYKLHMPDKRPYSKIISYDTAPIDSKEATYFQKMAAIVGMKREIFINQILEKLINKYNKVLIIYGSGHIVKSRKVYEKAMGLSVNKKYY